MLLQHRNIFIYRGEEWYCFDSQELVDRMHPTQMGFKAKFRNVPIHEFYITVEISDIKPPSPSAANDELLIAAWAGDFAAIRAAIARGADVNAADSDGWTAYHLALQGNQQLVLEYLQILGARPPGSDFILRRLTSCTKGKPYERIQDAVPVQPKLIDCNAGYPYRIGPFPVEQRQYWTKQGYYWSQYTGDWTYEPIRQPLLFTGSVTLARGFLKESFLPPHFIRDFRTVYHFELREGLIFRMEDWSQWAKAMRAQETDARQLIVIDELEANRAEDTPLPPTGFRYHGHWYRV